MYSQQSVIYIISKNIQVSAIFVFLLLLYAGSLQQQQQQSYTTQQQRQSWLQQQQQQMTGTPITAACSQVPSLQHPSTIQLQLDDNKVRDAAGNVLLDNIDGNVVALNPKESQYGALVFGASSQQGPASCWDVNVGSVSISELHQDLGTSCMS